MLRRQFGILCGQGPIPYLLLTISFCYIYLQGPPAATCAADRKQSSLQRQHTKREAKSSEMRFKGNEWICRHTIRRQVWNVRKMNYSTNYFLSFSFSVQLCSSSRTASASNKPISSRVCLLASRDRN